MEKKKQRERGAPSICGELISYTRGCRCALCRSANAAYNRELRARRGKAYVRDCNLKHTHGLSRGEYQRMFEEQSGVCAVCKKPETKKNQYGVLSLAVDHNHDNGEIRGLLCMKCNRSLGMLEDSAEIIQSLLEYRKKFT